MAFSEDEKKLLTESFDKIAKDVANLHRDVSAIVRKILPNEEREKPIGRWPPVKSFDGVRTGLAWLAGGFESIQADVNRLNARLDVVMNDAHAYDEMKEHLKRPPPRRRQDDR